MLSKERNPCFTVTHWLIKVWRSLNNSEKRRQPLKRNSGWKQQKGEESLYKQERGKELSERTGPKANAPGLPFFLWSSEISSSLLCSHHLSDFTVPGLTHSVPIKCPSAFSYV
ncbi:hypothetical protein GOODEAATRI_025817 [Goodea atripinnis]|uniref:Uncharacterized protein n=1 Tax=Goodea atripinnis TaxID=208336 RepID=A0ABV0NZM0_9TELE